MNEINFLIFQSYFKSYYFRYSHVFYRITTLEKYSQRQLCKWISKLVEVYVISTFLVLVGIFMFIFSEHKLSFYISIALWIALWLRYDVSDFSRDLTTEVSRGFLGGAPSFWFSTLPSFGAHELCECGHKTFLICHVTTWLMHHVTLWVGSPQPKSPTS